MVHSKRTFKLTHCYETLFNVNALKYARERFSDHERPLFFSSFDVRVLVSGQKIKLIREETGALITTPGEHEEHVFIIEAPPEIALRVAHHLTARAHEITQSKLAAGERRRGSTSSQSASGLENGMPTSGFGNPINNGNNSAVNSCPPSSSLMPLNNSATNSPLHPAASGALAATLMPSSGASGNGVGTGVLRTPNSSLFSTSLSSMPSSPCSSSALNATVVSQGTLTGNGTNSSVGGGGSGGLFLSTNAPGSRVLLARSRISVPQELVGKIIGTQGSIITTIQKDTGTEIKSPPKEAARGPNATSEFEISAYQGLGLSSNQAAECRVQQAKQLIGHLVMRQLERRASEEVDEASGSSNLSSDEQRLSSGTSGNTPRTNHSWMWPDVAQMDSQEAREVLDRILAESKNKTRRAKELAAAAAAGSAGPSPTSNGQSLTNSSSSILSMSGAVASQPVGLLTSEQQHFHAQLLGPPGLFDSIDSNDFPGDMSSRDLTQPLGDPPGHGLFGSQSSHFATRSSSTTLVDEAHHHAGIHRGGHNCSPRAATAFTLQDPNDLMVPFQRAPGHTNMGTDLWNALPNYASSITNNNSSHNSTVCDSPTAASNHLQTLLSSGGGTSAMFSSASPSSATHDASMLLLRHKQTNLNTNGFGGINVSFDEPTTVFNFNEAGIGPTTSFSSGVDLSPTLLMHYRAQQQQQHAPGDLIRQPLTRRHSDWVVSSSNSLLDTASQRPGTASRQLPSSRLGLATESLTQREANASPFSSSGGYDFMRALDQLCLSSSVEPVQDNVVCLHSSSNNLSPSHSLPHCPPGFEALQHPSSAEDLNGNDTSVSSIQGPWSTGVSNSGSLFMPSHALSRDFTTSKISLLRRLFSGSQTTTLLDDASDALKTAARLNAIWSPHDGTNDSHGGDTDDGASYTFPVYANGAAAELIDAPEDQAVSRSDGVNLYNCITTPDTVQPNFSPNESSSRCGTIGEGRRRRHGQSPPISNELEPIAPMSVPSTITSITEVA
ncbi:uncharacterized protein DEA37_0001334 [Paragonimus westermani]|uniref:K Homology domain-containing protein n=1 Tax=Paragonimus westermani TaxID=34504 RepID=A0A5J4P2V5_9TREM|nr:uncharacterized protein DEA37_0001334 [Paragonimus westermani]